MKIAFRSRFVGLFLVASLWIVSTVTTQAQTPTAPSGIPLGHTGFYFTGSWRLRLEDYNWWPTDKADGGYSFLSSLIKLDFDRKSKQDDEYLELQQTSLVNLPTKAIASAPQGALGLGALYYDANGSQVASLFVKQAYVRLKDPSHPGKSLRVGRFEYSDGSEVVPADPTLNWVTQNRISQRLLGPTNFTDIGRSFNGLHYEAARPHLNLTAMAAIPSRGVFDLNGNDFISKIKVGYLNATFSDPDKQHPNVSRLFGIYYEDARTEDLKIDNRPAATRAADKKALRIGTVGGEYLRAIPAGAGKFDLMGWGAAQFGDWGDEAQGAYAYAAEAGYQMPKATWQPWLRIGYNFASGDGNPNNKQHGTFIPLLYTARTYARDVFYTESNIEDLFAQLILKPGSRTTVRTDVHGLRLAESNDLWYNGGGAYQNRTFGYTGRPSGGANNLGTLADISVDYQWRKSTNLTLYFGYGNGGDVISKIYKSRDSVFAYLEVLQKF
ncbi:MAG TPA: alginate export family protein [Chthonomonadaceae bacterium]|nr:alginate export family protein [Chthonomonadaceae bacterium]